MRGAARARRVGRTIASRARYAVDVWEAERGAVGHIPQSHENFRYRHFLLPTYLDYVSRVSWADHAVSLETAACLLQMCEAHQPSRVLDTGSGYSSYVLRRYAAGSGAEVVSVETDSVWLNRTASYLEEVGVGASGLVTWEEFQEARHQPFGLIFHDLASGGLRASSMAMMTGLVTPDGHLVFDDMQDGMLRAEARRVTEAAGRRFYSMAGVTLDSIRRYAGLSLGLGPSTTG